MASFRKLPTWAVLLGSDLPAGTEVNNILGAITADFEHPTHAYCPKDVRPVLKAFPESIEVEDSTVQEVLDRQDGEEIRAMLANLLRARLKKNDSDTRRLETRTIITRTLKQQRDIFNAIKEQHRSQIMELIRQNTRKDEFGEVAFMIVGVKTAFDTDLSKVKSLERQIGGSGTITVSEALALVDITPPPGVDLTLKLERGALRDVLRSCTADDERIFAVKYRQIRSKLNWMKHPREKDLVYGDILELQEGPGMSSPPEQLMGGTDVVEDGAAEEEEDDDVDDEDVPDDDLRLGYGMDLSLAQLASERTKFVVFT